MGKADRIGDRLGHGIEPVDGMIGGEVNGDGGQLRSVEEGTDGTNHGIEIGLADRSRDDHLALFVAQGEIQANIGAGHHDPFWFRGGPDGGRRRGVVAW